MINLLIIAWLCVFVIDFSGFIDEIEKLMKRMHPLFRVPKPFSCSLCMTWWMSLVYLLIVGKFTFGYVALAALLSLMTGQIAGVIAHIRGRFDRAIARAEWRDEKRTSEIEHADARRRIGY